MRKSIKIGARNAKIINIFPAFKDACALLFFLNNNNSRESRKKSAESEITIGCCYEKTRTTRTRRSTRSQASELSKKKITKIMSVCRALTPFRHLCCLSCLLFILFYFSVASSCVERVRFHWKRKWVRRRAGKSKVIREVANHRW